MPSSNSDAIYGLSKFVTENLIDINLRHLDIHSAHLRISQIYGKGMREDRLIPVLRRELKADGKMTLWGNGEREIPLIHISRLLEIIEIFIIKSCSGVYNIASEQFNLIEIANLIAKEEGLLEPEIILIPNGSRARFILVTKKLKKFLCDNQCLI